ncbi:transglycosylase family protein [Streptomyces beigongshangae]|uniref:LysM peptidoglycan-binding domain-containing protein n=1 Tax=Streptomyces beigongshangae TaxID=2841597 RepID=UPI001C8605CE|nr:transglycosylase family protein [Streptomyces sp. REN17]
MLSGNGRHRRPRQAPALLVAAGVTGSAIAIPLLGAGAASAASGTTWDAVAECESDGSWSADTGNGLYGGLQISQETWEGYGGLDYAPSADQASRSQQIAVAEKILADQGTGAWATCALVSGLTQDSGSADVDTGLPEDSTASPDDSGGTKGSGGGKPGSSPDSGSVAKGETGSGSDAGSDADPAPDAQRSGGAPADDTAKGDDSGKSAQSDTASVETDTEGSGRHRGVSAEEADLAPRADDYAGRHVSRGDSESRVLVEEGSYVVRTGDSLSSIADSQDVAGGWSELYAANKDIIGTDPNFIIPGQSIEVDGGAVASK